MEASSSSRPMPQATATLRILALTILGLDLAPPASAFAPARVSVIRAAAARAAAARGGGTPALGEVGGSGQPLFSPRHFMEGPPPDHRIANLLPGTDTSLCMRWEPTIAVDPNDPRVVAVAQFVTIVVSFDGGVTFPVNVSAPGVSPGGDPSLAFDSQGRLFITYLCSPGAGRDVCITGYSVNAGAGTITQLPGGWPVNLAVAAGIGGNNADKEWVAADSTAGSPFQDRIYCTWQRLDTNPWSTWASFSTDQGQTWSAGAQLSVGLGQAWPNHVAVAPNGDVFAAWHEQPGFLDPSGNDVPDGVSGLIALRRSDDGGSNWQPATFPYPAGQADMTYNVQHEANGLIPGNDSWLTGSLQPWILPDPLVAGRVFVVQNDDPDNDVDVGDAANVYIVASSDSGDTWAARRRVDSGAGGTFQILPTAAINPVNGTIGVAYFDNRALADADNDGIFELDILATISTDAGVTWSPEVDINDGTMDPSRATTCRFCGGDGITNLACTSPGCPGPGTRRIGEYMGVAYGECTLHFAWPDDSTCGGGDYDTFYDNDPQLGGDLTPPQVACPADAIVGCGDPTDPSATGTATATDACDLDPGVTFSDQTLPGNCPPGSVIQTIRRTWRSTDAAGNTTTCDQDIVVTDMSPPSLFVPAPLVLECNSPGGVPANDLAIVAWLAGASAADDCSVPTLENDAPALFPFGCPPDGTVTIVTFTATDGCGKVTELSSSVAVVDTTPPSLDCSVTTPVLWPPSHALVDIGLVVVTSDGCDVEAPVVSIEVTSDEHASDAPGSGGETHCPDAVIQPDGHVLLRAERSGAGDGRVYIVHVTSTDSCGNSSDCSAQVSVPSSQSKKAVVIDSGQIFDATDCD